MGKCNDLLKGKGGCLVLHITYFKGLTTRIVEFLVYARCLNSKSEIGISKQIRKTKVEKRKIQTVTLPSLRIFHFEFRVCFGFLISNFVFVSTF